MTLFLAQYLWINIQAILGDYLQYVLAYIGAAAVISFAYLYYRGPVTNPRVIDLIKWTLQFMSIILIYNGSQIPEVVVGIVMVLFLAGYFPLSSLSCFDVLLRTW